MSYPSSLSQVRFSTDGTSSDIGWGKLLFFVDVPRGLPDGPARMAFGGGEPEFAFIRWFTEARGGGEGGDMNPLELAGCTRLTWAKRKCPLTAKKNVDWVDLIPLSDIEKVVYIVPDFNVPAGDFFHLSRFKTTSVIY